MPLPASAGRPTLGFLTVAAIEAAGVAHARLLSTAAGFGLVSFEATEWAWLGPQPLEFVFLTVGAAIAVTRLRR